MEGFAEVLDSSVKQGYLPVDPEDVVTQSGKGFTVFTGNAEMLDEVFEGTDDRATSC